MIDFEERRLGNPEDLPMHWTKLSAPDMPHYVNGHLSTGLARSGRYSFRFDLNGGSLAYRYDNGQIPVRAGAHYRVEGYVRTTALPHARARLSAYFTDLDGHELTHTRHDSEPYASDTGQDAWKQLSVELTADDPRDAFLVIEIGLLQPDRYARSSLGPRELYPQDITGACWWDDIAVWQVPQLTLATDRPGNIFRRSDPLQLRVTVNDRSTSDLSALLVVRDAAGQSVYQQSGALDMRRAQVLSPGQVQLPLDLPQLKPGWYQADLAMSSNGQRVGQQTIGLVKLADDAAVSAPDPRFGIVATQLPFEAWDQLPEILPLLGAGRIKLAVWTREGDIQQVNPAAFDRLLEQLSAIGITPTACLVALPPNLEGPTHGRGWPGLLSESPDAWQPQLADLIARHATHLQRWQLGPDGSDAFVEQPVMRQVYQSVYRQFALLMNNPDLAMPWPAWYELDGQLPATVALSVPPAVLPAQLPLYMQDLARHPGHNLSINLQLLDAARYGRELRIRDLAQRVIYALSADAQRIDLPLPFSVQRRDHEIVKEPQELLMVVRTLVSTLSGARFCGKVPIAEGVDAFLFERNGQGILALWDRSSETGVKSLAINVGPRPCQVDLWGNVTPLARPTAGDDSASSSDRDDGVRLSVGPMPTFLVGVDAPLAQLRASIALDRPLIESSFQPHTRHLRFVNPYRQAIAGSFRLRAPAGWIVNPPAQTFTLNPGELFDRAITIEFPYNSFAGPKVIHAEFTVQADGSASFVAPLVLNLGLSDVGMQSLAVREGRDVLVQQIISNYGDHPIDYTAFAVYPGEARQERLVTNLAPGRTTVKRYRFSNVKLTPNAAVRVGVRELMGMRVLNDEVAIQ